jgi:putative flavoprotein involved in K+ transport
VSGASVTNPASATAQTAQEPRERYDVAVIGAGQAGLALGYYLKRQGRPFVILEAADSVGAAWRGRWDSLRLFTPRRYDALPAAPFPGDPDGYPTRDEVITYLEQYAKEFDLPIELNSPVHAVSAMDGKYLLELEGRTIGADQVVVATGPFQIPRVPSFSGDLAAEVFQTHSVGYRKPADVLQGTVLVVGGGNTGFQIAKELSVTHRVYLSVGSRQTPLPQRLLGRDLFWWLAKLGLLDKTIDSRLGRRMRERDVLIGSSPRAVRRHGVELKSRAVGASGRTITFADSTEIDVDAVIWASGYDLDHSWIKVPVATEGGRIRHERGVTESAGLYFVGLPWQYTRGSALLGWVKDDAEYIADLIAAAGRQTDKPTRERNPLPGAAEADVTSSEGAP